MDRENNLYDVIIIGAGIAGMTAAIYTRRANKSVLIFESKVSGGQIVNAIDVRNWPGEERISGEELSEKIYHQMNNFGVDFHYETVEKISKLGNSEPNTEEKTSSHHGKNDHAIFKIQTDEGEYQGLSLIIATGSRDKELGVENEKELIGHGLSYCVTCDGELFKDQDVAVVGGGNTAMYDVMYLANLAHKVYLVHRRAEFRADASLVEQVKKLENVEIITNSQFGLVTHEGKVVGFKAKPKEAILGPEIATSDSLAKTSDLGPKSDPATIPISADTNPDSDPATTPISAVFVAIGRTPETEIVRNLVNLDKNGYIVADESCQTSESGIFAAGDCRTKQVRQLITAASDGAAAATAAVEYLNRQDY